MQNCNFNPNTILENLEHISYPLEIKLYDDHKLMKLLVDKTPCQYTSETVANFFYSEYKVAIVADMSCVKNI